MKRKYKEIARQSGFTNCTKTMQHMLERYANNIVNQCAAVADQCNTYHRPLSEVAKIIEQHFEDDGYNFEQHVRSL